MKIGPVSQRYQQRSNAVGLLVVSPGRVNQKLGKKEELHKRVVLSS